MSQIEVKTLKWVLPTSEDTPGNTYQVIQVLGDRLICYEMTGSLEGRLTTLTEGEYEDITELVEDFDFKVGDRVCHVKDNNLCGQIIYIDFNLIAGGESSTTCLVLWDGGDVGDIQWTNKLIPLEPKLAAPVSDDVKE